MLPPRTAGEPQLGGTHEIDLLRPGGAIYEIELLGPCGGDEERAPPQAELSKNAEPDPQRTRLVCHL